MWVFEFLAWTLAVGAVISFGVWYSINYEKGRED